VTRILCILILWCSAAPAATILFNISSPTAINNNGQIVGVALPNTDAFSQKFVFGSAGVTTEAVGYDGSASNLTGINNSG
jgi:uncharacterized membrane protein